MPQVRFKKPKSYNGRDYYAGDTADVDVRWARQFVRSGAAELVSGEIPKPGPITAEEIFGPPQPQRRKGKEK